MNQMTIWQPSSQDTLVGLLPFWNQWILALREGLENLHPRVKPFCGLDITNKVLEFLSTMVTILLALVECKERGSKQHFVITLGNNNISRTGWLHKLRKLFSWACHVTKRSNSQLKNWPVWSQAAPSA